MSIRLLPASAVLAAGSFVTLAGCSQSSNPGPQIFGNGDTQQAGKNIKEPQRTPHVDMIEYRTDMFKRMEETIVTALCSRAYNNAFILNELLQNDSYEMKDKDEAKQLLAEYDAAHRRFYNLERSQIPGLRSVGADFLNPLLSKAANHKDIKNALSQMIATSQRMDPVIATAPTTSVFRHCEPMLCSTEKDQVDEFCKVFLDEQEINKHLKPDLKVVNYQYSFFPDRKAIEGLYDYHSKGKADPKFIRTTGFTPTPEVAAANK